MSPLTELGRAILEDAERLLREKGGTPSISYIQRKLRLRYMSAARIMEALEERGAVSPCGPGGIRTLLGTPLSDDPKGQREKV